MYDSKLTQLPMISSIMRVFSVFVEDVRRKVFSMSEPFGVRNTIAKIESRMVYFECWDTNSKTSALL